MRTTLRARFVASEIHALLFVFMWVFYSLSSQALADGLSGPLFTILLVADLPISFVAFGVMFTSTRYGVIAAALWGVLGTAWWFLIGVAIDARVRKYQESRASNQGLTTTRVHSERKYSIRIEASIAASVVALLLAVSLALAWNGYHGHFDKGAIGNLVFAPDGQSIAFVRSQDNSSIIERLDLLTGRTAAITKAIPCKVNSPAYSPDAKQIAVACASGNRSRILLVDADGDNLHPLFSSSEGRYDFAPHFSTDGREIYFAKAVSFSGLTTTTSAASPDSWMSIWPPWTARMKFR